MGTPGFTSPRTMSKFFRDASTLQVAAPSGSGSRRRRVPTLPPWQVRHVCRPSRLAVKIGCTRVRNVSKSRAGAGV